MKTELWLQLEQLKPYTRPYQAATTLWVFFHLREGSGGIWSHNRVSYSLKHERQG